VGPPASSKPLTAVRTAIRHPAPSTTDIETTAKLKAEFVDALPADLKELLQLEIETMGDDWFVALRSEFVKPYFRDVSCRVTRRVWPRGRSQT
jgi:hypothetical protein